MKKLLHISPDLKLPLTAITQTFGILAVRGAGKSNTGVVMAEEMYDAGLPFVVIDPVGAWWGLRSSADGKSAGLPIPIFGGRHADVPIDRATGELVADLVVGKRLSCVIDISEFESEQARKDFLLNFAQRLYRKNTEPLHLFLEEADDYIPQKPMRDEARLLRAWENIVRRGRGRGIGITLITQRSAVLNKNVLTQIETLFAMRTTGPQDRKAIEAWVKYQDLKEDLLASLPELETGEAWCWSPWWLKGTKRIRIRRRRTFDSAATPKQQRGQRRPATLADVDLPALEREWTATVKRIEGDNPKALRRQAEALEREKKVLEREKAGLEQKLREKPAAPEPVIEYVEVPVLPEADIKRLEALIREVDQKLVAPFQSLDKFASAAKDSLTKILAAPRPAPPTKPRLRTPIAKTSKVTATPPTPALEPTTLPEGGDINEGALKILTAIAQYPEGVDDTQIAILTGYKPTSRREYIRRLRGAGYITGKEPMIATAEGMAALGDNFEPLPTGSELLIYWQAKLKKGEALLLNVIVEAYPDSVDRAIIADKTGYKNTSIREYLRQLKGRKIIDELTGERGRYRASDMLFDG